MFANSKPAQSAEIFRAVEKSQLLLCCFASPTETRSTARLPRSAQDDGDEVWLTLIINVVK